MNKGERREEKRREKKRKTRKKGREGTYIHTYEREREYLSDNPYRLAN